ncbi:hypothetical protein [Arthrobacter sp. A2-55]|uniref:hypothetical protein n=1 Tax=Arthrobacter sp. A2-55 TaxID=2897337 RepID=UPI0021CD61A5|nr:hypothetical protein [Arthrobacter sp. A2-55]MCU6482542.1 hypothetical protein [Arthrobacter sp. A2-55]
MPANHADPNATLSAPPHGPVFVDASGRRLRRIKVMGLGVLGLAAGYVILLLIAFLGGPNAAAPFLPLGISPAAPAAVPAAPPASHRPTSTATPLSNGGPLQASERQSGAAPGVPGTAAAGCALGAGAAAAPGKSGSSPGQAKRPTPPAHP